jgi:hypothetical protein
MNWIQDHVSINSTNNHYYVLVWFDVCKDKTWVYSTKIDFKAKATCLAIYLLTWFWFQTRVWPKQIILASALIRIVSSFILYGWYFFIILPQLLIGALTNLYKKAFPYILLETNVTFFHKKNKLTFLYSHSFVYHIMNIKFISKFSLQSCTLFNTPIKIKIILFFFNWYYVFAA